MKNISRRYIGGFTLLELLVVVLIIGILSAIALPQYTKAVNKARMSEPLTVMKSIHQAMSVYYMTNGEWPTQLDQLDVDVPTGDWTYRLVQTTGRESVTYNFSGEQTFQPKGWGSIAAWNSKLGGGRGKGAIFYSIPERVNYNIKPGIFCCLWAAPYSDQFKEFCKASQINDDSFGLCQTGEIMRIQSL